MAVTGKDGDAGRAQGAAARGAVAIFGATSGIARAVTEILMARGEGVILIGRSRGALEALAADLAVVAGRRPPCFEWDVTDFANHAARFRDLIAAHSPRGLFMAAGVLFPQDECDADPAKAILTFNSNLTGPAVVMDLFAAHFKAKGEGFISGVSSVAGERGRGKVLTYAASKAGLTAYLDGLRHRLAGTGVFVQTVKPGFVKTRMTTHVRSALMVEPAKAARDIVEGLDLRRPTVYTPFFWRYIMGIIKCIPGPIFQRLKL
jgi:decaprenylphospho-beta-D-erythro-pentofuranosid-2-ulose 2-reductase